MFELDVLGRMTLRSGDLQVMLRPMHRLVVLALLCAEGMTLTATRLSTLIWDGQPAEGAAQTLRSHISQMRKLIASAGNAELIETIDVSRVTAYKLIVERKNVDATRFEQLVAGGCQDLSLGQYPDAASRLREALSMWHGQPLQDAADRPFAHIEISRLEELHRTALTARIEADLCCGRHRETTGELSWLTEQWPGDVGLWRMFIISLYRSERTSEAAAACKSAAEKLRHLGLYDQRIKDLHQAMLNNSLPMQGPIAA